MRARRIPRALPADQMMGVGGKAAERSIYRARRAERDRMKEAMRVCEWEKCGKKFLPTDPRQRFCGRKHQMAAYNAVRLAAQRELPDPRVDYHEGDRYIVLATTGYRINSDGRWGASQRPPGTSYTVVDEAYGRTVAFFDPKEGVSSASCRRAALKLARERNADERAWEAESV